MNVRLDEANVTLNDRTDVLHPLDRGSLMGKNRASSESITLSGHRRRLEFEYLRFNILVDHFRLMVIGSVFFGLEILTVSLGQ